MSSKTVVDPTGSGFKYEKAQELTYLTREARLLYLLGKKESKKHPHIARHGKFPKYVPLNDQPLPEAFEKNQYKLLKPLIFTQRAMGFWRKQQVFGFIAESIKKDALYVVFRGTQTTWDWLSNFRIFQVSTRKNMNLSIKHHSPIEGEAHAGFMTQYVRRGDSRIGRLDPISEVIEDTLTAEFVGDRPIYLAGHSLGGALATLAAAHLQGVLGEQTKIFLYTFASPRVGDEAFEEYYHHRNIDAYRIYNHLDLVPKLPPRFDFFSKKPQYVHVGEPIPFTKAFDFRFRLFKSIGNFHYLRTYAGALGLNRSFFNHENDQRALADAYFGLATAVSILAIILITIFLFIV